MKLALILMIALTPMASSRRIQSKVGTVLSTENKEAQDNQDLLVKDLDKEMTVAKTEEKDAQGDYEQMMKDSAAKRADDSKTLADKQGTLADLESFGSCRQYMSSCREDSWMGFTCCPGLQCQSRQLGYHKAYVCVKGSTTKASTPTTPTTIQAIDAYTSYGTGNCQGAGGAWPSAYWVRNTGETEDSCKAHCTSLSECLSYNYEATASACTLRVSSVGTPPSGFNIDDQGDSAPTTVSQTDGNTGGGTCYVKASCTVIPASSFNGASDFTFTGGASWARNDIRSGSTNTNSEASMSVAVPAGKSTLSFEWQYVSGYCKNSGVGTPAKVTLEIGGQVKWSSSIDFSKGDYPYDSRCGGKPNSYSPAQTESVSTGDLSGTEKLVWKFVVTNRNIHFKLNSLQFCPEA